MAANRDALMRLADPFPPSDVEWRVQSSGERNGRFWARVLAYITNRAIMERLDTVVGPENWRNEFRASVGAKEGGVLCGLTIRCDVASDGFGNSEWITKWDGADETDIEATKGGISSAMKRAGVQWGIGRYLYELEEGWAVVGEQGRHSAKAKNGTFFKWDPPELPVWALPGGSGKPDGVAPVARPSPVRTITPAPGREPLRAVPVVEHVDATAPVPVAPVPSTGDPACPKCGGRVWDNRIGKRNPKAPDFKCRDRSCDGVIWPPRDGKSTRELVAMTQAGDDHWEPAPLDEEPY